MGRGMCNIELKYCDKVWPYYYYDMKYEIWEIQAPADKNNNSRTSVAKICIIWIIEIIKNWTRYIGFLAF